MFLNELSMGQVLIFPAFTKDISLFGNAEPIVI